MRQFTLILLLAACLFFTGLATAQSNKVIELTDAQMENLVHRSYQYVAMFNVNNKGAMHYGVWNVVDVGTKLKDHTLKVLARPNNDSLYAAALCAGLGEVQELGAAQGEEDQVITRKLHARPHTRRQKT